ncbi:uncharacterized protein LOC121651457 [Melanotaenia boesemani]|uniref:uncharacterized protein LOC121651457 n=1 Tax=Melanotaenia boesemani TaxID=1250792 RepID=UPI001C04A5A6|nr:uncharacterized protein LOC121651457 [Melanotaenia boesemani]
MEDCHQYHLLVQRSGLSFSMCHHIRSVDYCTTTATEEPLRHEVLHEMMENHFFGGSKVEVCKKRQMEAKEACVPLSLLLNLSRSKNHIYFSVYEPELYHYSTLGRVIVTYNIKKKHLALSLCKGTHILHSQVYCQVASFPKTQTPFHDHKTDHHSITINSPWKSSSRYRNGKNCKVCVRVQKIPTSLPEEVTAQRMLTDYRQSLFPDETTCQLCPDTPELEEAAQVTNKARIVGMQGVIQNISTYNRHCTRCKMVYRYQKWRDGLHNFNDRVILTLQLCVYLRHNLQNHVSVSRVISCLESLLKIDFPAPDLIFQGYCHFEALCNTEYKYSCVNCGFYPPVVVMDLHRKGVFSFEVSELKQPKQDFHGEHDIVAFWESVSLHMISQGFFQVPSQNPFVVKPTYDNWASWIGEETRQSNTVLNTEYEKVPSQRSSGEPQLGDLTEDHLVDELLRQKVSTIRKLCKSCNMDTKGSRMDLINQLREEMKSRQAYDKIFQSIWGASGGWSVIMCPHGIVYSLKFNLRAKSPRDFADLLLSWKHLPNVCIYDFARGLVAHAKSRVPDNSPFQPFDGRLADLTEENVEAAAHGKLRVHLPWLVEKLEPSLPNGHPITGSNNHYVLYDKFHQANAKDPQEVLRRIRIAPELQATLNSQVAEQLFACLLKNNYFLNNMGPSAHIFLMRNILEHRNNNQNEKLLKRQLIRGLQVQQLHATTLSDLGQVILGQQMSTDNNSVEAEPCSTTLQQTLTDLGSLGAETKFSEEETVIDCKTPPKSSNAALSCGHHCASITELYSVQAKQSSWSFILHQDQEQVLNYVLDTRRPGNEVIVRTLKSTLTRSDFLTLGLRQDMESTIGNACFEIIEKIALSKGTNVYVVDLYICPTWLPPLNNNPMASLPTQAHQKDAVFIPLWTPGHFQICVI